MWRGFSFYGGQGARTARCVFALLTLPPDTSRSSVPRPVPSFGGTPQATTLSLRTLYVRSDHERRVSTGPSGYRFGASSEALHGGEDVHPTQVTSPLFGFRAMPRHMNTIHGSSNSARPKDGPRPTLPQGGRIGVSFAQNHRHARDAASHCSEAVCAHPGSGAYGFLNEHCTRRGTAPKVPAPSVTPEACFQHDPPPGLAIGNRMGNAHISFGLGNHKARRSTLGRHPAVWRWR